MKHLLVALGILGLTGCVNSVPVKDTIPSPTEEVASGAYQMRLHQTYGEKVIDGSTGILARPYVSGDVGAGGNALGCTLTSLGEPPARLKARLTTKDCEAVLEGEEGGGN